MTISQTGVFRNGTYGFPVQITLSSTPIALSAATAINLAIKRPTETDYDISSDLAVPGSILDSAAGVIQWTPADGDLNAPGDYDLILTIDFGPNMRLTVEGVMKVS